MQNKAEMMIIPYSITHIFTDFYFILVMKSIKNYYINNVCLGNLCKLTTKMFSHT